MTAPTALPVNIYIDGVNVTSFVPYSSLQVDQRVRETSTMRCTVENPSGVTIARNKTVKVVASIVIQGTPVIFNGYISEVKTRKLDNGLAIHYEIEAVDQKMRLAKTQTACKIYTGTDLEILGDLLSESYPDLSANFNFDYLGVSNASNLELPVCDQSLAQAIDELADLAGVEDFSIGEGDIQNLFLNPRFALSGDTDKYIRSYPNDVPTASTDYYNYIGYGFPEAWTVVAGGKANDTNKARQQFRNIYAGSVGTIITFNETVESGDGFGTPTEFGTKIKLQEGYLLSFSFWAKPSWVSPSFPSAPGINLNLNFWDAEDLSTPINVSFISGGSQGREIFSAAAAWYRIYVHISIDFLLSIAYLSESDIGKEVYPQFIFRFEAQTSRGASTSDTMEISNPMMTYIPTVLASELASGSTNVNIEEPVIPLVDYFSGDDEGAIWQGDEDDSISIGDSAALRWNNPEDAPFDIDIDAGDEFAFDVEFTEGDIEDYNSIAVVGGHEEVAIDWTYESDGDLTHFALETQIRDYTIYKNTNTDASPTWTAQTAGVWGVDTLTGDGGSADVLVDTVNNWLYFNSAPSNLSKSIRVTGNILKPIKVRVEDVAAGDPTYTKVVYDDSITTEEQAVALGSSILARHNAPRRLNFKTYEPGLRAGQMITVTDSGRGLNETIQITRVAYTWLGASGHVLIDVECGDDISIGIDDIVANNDKRNRASSGVAAVATSASVLTDDDGLALQDNNLDLLYEVN